MGTTPQVRSNGKSNGHFFDNDDCPYEPGKFVPFSGLYEICHADEARASVVFTKEEVFPECRRCGSRVRYKLLHAAPHISEDPDFAASQEPEDNPETKALNPSKQFPRQLGAAHGFRYWQQPVPTG